MSRFANALQAAKQNAAFDSGSIGTLSEKTLHSVLKYYLEPCDDFHEVAVGSYVADILRDGCIIEIQTRAFDRLRKKLSAFLKEYPVTVVFPIAKTKWYYITDSESGEVSEKKKSPKYGNIYDAFKELYKIKMLLDSENLYFHFVLLDITEYRRTVKKSRRNHKGIELVERIPNAIEEEVFIDGKEDFGKLIPEGLPSPFTSKDFAKAIKRPRSVAQTALNVLSAVGAVEHVGKDKNTYLYRTNSNSASLV
ncbi:MAG: hypothetical protein IIU58_06465 [Clostridia bacterium]|nr:hypothetical protein [Clostridia bacterium]